MKVISARQVWHDALHENRASALAVAAEQAALGKKGGSGDVKIMVMLENHDGQEVCKVYEVRKEGVQETRPGRRLTNDRCAHMLTAGLVLQAIDSLPKSLRHLGHFLYSPVASGNDLSISHGLVWLGSGLEALTDRKKQRAYWMAMAALQSHKILVHGGEAMGPGAVCMFVEDRTGEKMNPQNWARDWQEVWDALCSQVDKLDKQALKPVARVVERLRERNDEAQEIAA
ncbi:MULTISPECIES: hypothetical protein [Pseudomonas]|uniref:Uncharacterized protein n=1 Tax=Pseudomonas plecoglossicida TaxID=70775 RepID=A0ABX4U4S7_PSEDL|nr:MULTISPECIES: hypothetical protein [Pseudomonas putida group]PLU86323.1 hypothetical protein CXG44_15895 [Pseudomonas plecoglossicida]PLU94076.1 hypothetical protein CXG45_07835 [Pseudomonas plecoglossicida]PLV04917.1 hypothetical protein CXG48_07695 [Pseudomonas plecoglossicida]PLV14262.1 hypothetical protein CXG47_12775 [Pseudomonas plecoglossicida]BBR53506.1 hypothetical protein WP4W18C03_18330 [Pseudomonas putida]